MTLEYEPSSERLLISVKQLFIPQVLPGAKGHVSTIFGVWHGIEQFESWGSGYGVWG